MGECLPRAHSVCSGWSTLISVVSAFLASQQEYEISQVTLILVVSLIGWLGCQIDSLLGALLENDGYVGKHTVNLLATSSGAVLAVLFTNQFSVNC